MRVLITNWTMIGHGGTQTFTAMIGSRLQDRGHDVMVYTPRRGPISAQLAARGIVVTDRLDVALPEPDIIHGHQGPDVAAALVRFPHTPALFMSRTSGWWFDLPPGTPRILRWLAVDEHARDWLIEQAAPPGTDIEVIPNRIDLPRFAQRPPLPARPKRALLFVNHPLNLEAVTSACAQCGLELDGLGSAFGRLAWDPGPIVAQYDIVFTSARKALESICVGAAVIVCDERGMGGLVTSENFPKWRRQNFAARVVTQPVSADALIEQIRRYDPCEARAISDAARADADVGLTVDRLEGIYREMIAEFRTRRQEIAAREPPALAHYFTRWLPDPVIVAAPAVAALLTPEDHRIEDNNRMVAKFVLDRDQDPQGAVITIFRPG